MLPLHSALLSQFSSVELSSIGFIDWACESYRLKSTLLQRLDNSAPTHFAGCMLVYFLGPPARLSKTNLSMEGAKNSVHDNSLSSNYTAMIRTLHVTFHAQDAVILQTIAHNMRTDIRLQITDTSHNLAPRNCGLAARPSVRPSSHAPSARPP